jgi:hypothetical protein
MEMHRRTYTAAAASLTGHASNVTGAAWVIATAGAADGLAHHVTIRNDSATNHSAKTIVLVGTGANGEALTETLAAPGTSATVTSTKAFKTLTSATPSATIGADTFDIGWAATGHTPWVDLRPNVEHFAASAAVYLVSGSLGFDGQHTYDSPPTEDGVAFNTSALTAKSASTDASYTAPITGFRVDVNSHTSAVFTVVVLQAGHL